MFQKTHTWSFDLKTPRQEMALLSVFCPHLTFRSTSQRFKFWKRESGESSEKSRWPFNIEGMEKSFGKFLFAWHDIRVPVWKISSYFLKFASQNTNKGRVPYLIQTSGKISTFVQVLHFACSKYKRRSRNSCWTSKVRILILQIRALRWKAKVRERKERRNWFYVVKVLLSTWIEAASIEHFFSGVSNFQNEKQFAGKYL